MNPEILIGLPGIKELVNLYALPPEALDAESIIKTLANINRFNGRGTRRISVLHHSIFVASILKAWNSSPGIVLGGFCHDFAEAFTGDVIKPIKDYCPELEAIELSIIGQMSFHFNIGLPLNKAVKEAERLALCFEALHSGFIIDKWGLYAAKFIKADVAFNQLLQDSLAYSVADALALLSELQDFTTNQ